MFSTFLHRHISWPAALLTSLVLAVGPGQARSGGGHGGGGHGGGGHVGGGHGGGGWHGGGGHGGGVWHGSGGGWHGSGGWHTNGIGAHPGGINHVGSFYNRSFYPGYGRFYGNYGYPGLYRSYYANYGYYPYRYRYPIFGFGFSPWLTYLPWLTGGYSYGPYYGYGNGLDYGGISTNTSFYSADQAATSTPEQAPALSDREVLFLVVTPPNADVWVNGLKSTQMGAEREFTTSDLTPVKTYSYEIRARWTQNDQTIERTRRVPMKPGSRYLVDFFAPESVPPGR